MGKDLYDTYTVARQVVDEADDALEGTLKNVMFEGSQEELRRTENAQPAILTTSIAMLRVLESERGFKIEESCKHALGHSLGEYSALVATKAVTLRDAVKLVVSVFPYHFVNIVFAPLSIRVLLTPIPCWIYTFRGFADRQ